MWDHEDGYEDISTESYHVPEHIVEHIDYITPGTRLRPVKKRSLSKKDQGMQKRNIFDHAKATVTTPLAGSPVPYTINSTSCSTYIVADCLRRESLASSFAYPDLIVLTTL
jgi:tripeptidyl-peptidase-1